MSGGFFHHQSPAMRKGRQMRVRSLMKNKLFLVALVAGSLCSGQMFSQSQDEKSTNKVEKGVEDVRMGAAKSGEDTAKATAKGAEKAEKQSKKTGRKVGKESEGVGKEVGKGAEVTAKGVAKGGEKSGEYVVRGTEEVGKDVKKLGKKLE
jgi:hypothetical protein